MSAILQLFQALRKVLLIFILCLSATLFSASLVFSIGSHLSPLLHHFETADLFRHWTVFGESNKDSNYLYVFPAEGELLN